MIEFSVEIRGEFDPDEIKNIESDSNPEHFRLKEQRTFDQLVQNFKLALTNQGFIVTNGNGFMKEKKQSKDNSETSE